MDLDYHLVAMQWYAGTSLYIIDMLVSSHLPWVSLRARVYKVMYVQDYENLSHNIFQDL